MATTKKTDTGKTTASRAASQRSEPSYREKAATLAGDTRELAEEIRSDIDQLVERVNTLQQDNEPAPEDTPAVDGVRRIPMACGDVTRALDGLIAAAADLQRAATS